MGWPPALSEPHLSDLEDIRRTRRSADRPRRCRRHGSYS